MRFKDSKPFYRVKSDDENSKSRVITLRINIDEEADIRYLKNLFDVEADAKAIKIAWKIGKNVILNTFGEESIKYLSSTKRERQSDYKKPEDHQKDFFVIHKKPEL